MVIKWSENSLMHANVMIRIETWSEKQFKASVIVMCAATLSLCVVSAENFSIHTLRSNLVLLRSHTELRSCPPPSSDPGQVVHSHDFTAIK